MSVATPPRRASLIAASASAPTVSALVDSCTQRETLRATPTMSDASGASSAWWLRGVVTDDVDDRPCAARRALWRLASPLPRPGPRCNSVAAGLPAMRP